MVIKWIFYDIRKEIFMIQNFETDYGVVKQIAKFSEDEIEVIKILLARMDEWNEVRKFDDLNRKTLEDLDSASVISLRKGVIIVELNIAIPLTTLR
jgi:hypothetical protein